VETREQIVQYPTREYWGLLEGYVSQTCFKVGEEKKKKSNTG
jgi:hypothetical protein